MRRILFLVFIVVGLVAACSDPDIIPQNTNTIVSENQNVSDEEVTDLSMLKPENSNTNLNENSNIISNAAEKGTVVFNRQSSARFEIVSIDGNYQDKNALFKRNVAQEYQLVRVGIRVTGTSDLSFPFDSLNFSLDTPTTKTILESELGKANEVQDHVVEQVQLAKEKSVQGALYFEVPKEIQVSDMILSYESLTEQKGSLEYKIKL